MAICETILGAVLQVVFDRLASKQAINFFKSSKIDQSLVDKLKDLMLAAGKLLADAEQKQITDDQVKLWLSDLKHLFYRAEEIADQIATEGGPKSSVNKVWNWIPAFSSSSSFASTVSSQISELVTQLDRKVHLSGTLNLREGSVDVNTASRRDTTSYFQRDDKVFGRDQEKEELLKFLFSEEAERNKIGVVAIVGMGGMGKTTLAKSAYNYERLEAFQLKAWVYVSDHFDIFRVIKSILESITGQTYSGSLELENLYRELRGKLRDKRFFLVLDDVWCDIYEEWECLWTPLTVGAHGSKIIVTTRKETVATIMRTVPVVRLKPLSDADGWLLFSKHAFVIENSCTDPRLEVIGRRIVDKCQGLPLAIKALGGLLRSKEGVDEWEAILQSTLWDLLDNKANVARPALRLSYHYLSSQLKRCFSYCAIFPKGYRFDRKKLVLMWMAENFVKPSESERRVEDIGEDYLKQLVSCSFFDNWGASVIMHDLTHDLAKAVSGNFFARLEHGDQTPRISEKARYFSFSRGFYDKLSRFEGLQEAKYLRTFVPLQGHQSFDWHLSNEIPVAMISKFCCLHVLSFSEYKALKLPESIGNLKQLRYLDVSRTGIKELPESVSTICNLQTLLLSGCSHLERLPADMSMLVSLRHLDISETTSLRQMPNHMSRLKCLQTLTGFVVGKHCVQGIEELRELLEIRGKLALRSLQNISSTDAVLEVNLIGREYINELAFEFDEGDNEDSEKGRVVLEYLKPHPNLEWLTIRNYPGTQFPSWLGRQCSVYEKIVNLALNGCKYCLSLPPLGQLPSLRYLEIVGMENIDVIGSELYGYDSGLISPFSVLRKLVIRDMKYLKEWMGYEIEGRLPFPSLEELELGNCPELKGELPANVRLLKVLRIWGCESLESSQGSQVAASQHRGFRISFHLASLMELELKGLKELVSLPPEVGILSCLDTLRLEECEKLKSLRNVRLPIKLGNLQIHKCKNLELLPKDMTLLNHFRVIYLTFCPCVKSTPEDSLPTSLQDLWVQWCERWEFPIPIELERMQCYSALEHLFISNIGGGLVSFPLGAFPNLQSLYIDSLEELERVNIPIGLDLINLTSLQHLSICDCPKLKWVGKTEEEGVVDLPTPYLQHLGITGSEMVKPLSRGDRQGLPSKLHSLQIDIDYYPNTVVTSLQRNLLMFSSLRELVLERHQGEDFPDKGCSLPVFITQLELSDFPKLKRLNGEALKTLTSLQQLSIGDCPDVECLPEEGLPPSLGLLEIWDCPKLEERCQKNTGLDWPKINHLPCVRINDNLIYF